MPPIESSTATPSTDPTSTHLTKKQELQAAEATVRQYFATVNELPARMNPRPLAALITSTCQCQAQVRAIKYYARRGEHFTQRAHVEAIKAVYDTPSLVEVLVRYSTPQGGVANSSGQMISETKAVRHQQNDFFVVPGGDGWLISKIEVIR